MADNVNLVIIDQGDDLGQRASPFVGGLKRHGAGWVNLADMKPPLEVDPNIAV